MRTTHRAHGPPGRRAGGALHQGRISPIQRNRHPGVAYSDHICLRRQYLRIGADVKCTSRSEGRHIGTHGPGRRPVSAAA